MAESGISVVTLANNHGGDQGSQGLRDTLRHCRQSGIAVVGAGKDLARAQQAAVLEKDGVKAAFLGFTDVLPVGFSATPFSPGVSPGRSDPQAVRQAISAAASQAHFTFVAWHWNFEYTTAPGALETNEGRAAIDAGADVVFGHHPHVLQGIETYNGGLICYSLGNLVFDNCTGPRAETVLVTTRVSDTEIEAVLTPVRIASSGQPFVAEGAQARRILQSVKQYSAALGTTVRISGGKGYVRVTRQPA
jgi:poly-gamma-glutamate synthesis protein (capsule biosynthesis protein)